MAIMMELTDSLSDSKLHKESAAKKESRPLSAVSLPKSCDQKSTDQVVSNEELRQYKYWVSNEKWIELKKIAETAMKEHKIFTIKGGGFPAVRHALLERGWVEKPDASRFKNNPFSMEPRKFTGSRKENYTRVERMILFKFMEYHSVDFMWTTKRDKYDWILSNKDVFISRFCRSIFTSKEGLCTALTQMHWYTEPGVAHTRFPRCYNVHNNDHLQDFIDDFRITACLSILKWFTSIMRDINDVESLTSCIGKVPFSALDFAITRLTEYISFFTHKDIDEDEESGQHVWEHEWDQFLTHHYLLVHEKSKFIEDKNASARAFEKNSANILSRMTKFWPQMELDGVLNIWILKPGNKCRGRGIQLMNNIKDIIGLVNSPSNPKTRYVIQKYIEKPLVIYKTKFDIRQWFLITNSQPLTIWMYKDSYLRFSSQIFNLSDYHESVHLTNNAVQTKYKNTGERDKALPDENMWDCHTFKTYLRQIGKAEIWDEKIYPGMKESLIGAMLASQDSMDKRQNSFELYGADFMLTEDFTPWLIEINSSPDLAPTTSVTARLCPQCLEDVIKVVLDKRTNVDADTGMFEQIYKQIIPKAPAYLGLSLSINGKRLFKKQKIEKRSDKPRTPVLTKSPNVTLETDVPMPSTYNGPVITDFLTWLQPFDIKENATSDKILNKDEPATVKHALTVVKSGLLLKNHHKIKRKSTTISSSRIRSGKKGQDQEGQDQKKNLVTPLCCKLEKELMRASTASYERKVKKIVPDNSAGDNKFWNDTENKSVGNKRCYIDPAIWEKETCSIQRATLSFSNRMGAKTECFHNITSNTSDIASHLSVNKVFPNLQKNSKFSPRNNCSPVCAKSFSAIGHSINKLRQKKSDNNNCDEENSIEKMNCLYGPYKIVVSPIERK